MTMIKSIEKYFSKFDIDEFIIFKSFNFGYFKIISLSLLYGI